MDKNIIKQLVGKHNPVLFEIGCADGGDTQDFVNIFGDTDYRLYCFEPEPTNIQHFKNRNLPTNVSLFEGAVSKENGITRFNRSRNQHDYNDYRYSGSVKAPKEHTQNWPHILFDEFVDVQTITLDDFCNKNDIELIDFIWADVQGAEDYLIEGGKNMFEKGVRYFYTEYSDREFYENAPNQHRIKDLLGNNWEIVHDFRTDVLLRNKNL